MLKTVIHDFKIVKSRQWNYEFMKMKFPRQSVVEYANDSLLSHVHTNFTKCIVRQL
jgi:hypothetical protein